MDLQQNLDIAIPSVIRYGRKVPHLLALGLRHPWSQPLIFGGLLWYHSARSYLAPVTNGGDLATTKLVFLAKLHTRTSQPEVPPIQIYYVKYLAMWLVWPDRFHKPPVVTGARYERLCLICARDF
jgi:hypothetical protein